MALYPDRHSATLPALGAAQRVHGWCSPEALRQVAAVMQVTPAYLSSVATFYDMLRTEPSGSRYVYVCTSVACHVRNAKQIYEAIAEQAEAQGLEDVELREFECLGACDMAPMASVDGRYVGPLSTDDASEFVRQVKAGETVLPGRGLRGSRLLGFRTRRRSRASRWSTRPCTRRAASGRTTSWTCRRRRGRPRTQADRRAVRPRHELRGRGDRPRNAGPT